MLESHHFSLLLFPQEQRSPHIIILDRSRFTAALKAWKTFTQFGVDLETFSNISDSDGALNLETEEIRLIQIAIQ